jgi:hypothetical protein
MGVAGNFIIIAILVIIIFIAFIELLKWED